ncbi:VirB4 family type IV secretion system protein [Caulobacter sp. 17J80-11]|uniref:VirB4 family type IV secretion system protein n=1 Tax=Caulobacter sp. 17J80-11 TaxID=2763502 RepID=UPI00165344DF|nr:VirB4 family type IV secretion system protein [Caulobacter sp. 17J80-11]MBC6983777.1 VirB4 family type IV secretion system protein [Caulobacter sp. 17J80-11]
MKLRDYAAFARKEQAAGDRLPYVGLADERTVILRDGGLMQCLHLTGFAFETADAAELNHKLAMRDAALRAIASSRYVVHHHLVRRRVEVDVDGEFGDPVSAEIDRRWRERLASRRLFLNELFVTVLRRPPKGKVGVAERLADQIARRVNAETRAATLAREIRELDAAREALAAALQPYGPRVLGAYRTRAGVCSEPLEFLSALFNGELRPMLAPAGDVGRHIPYRRVSFGLDAVERQGPAGERDFTAILSFKEYPPHATPGMLDPLLRLPYEMTLSEGFAFADRQIGLERVSTALRRFRAADDDSQSLRQGLVEAKDAVASGRAALGEHHLMLAVRAPSLEELDRAAAECVAVLADLGAVAVREDLALEPAFWGQFPGNEAYCARRAMVSTGAFAGLASLHGFPLGEASGNHWGPAVTALETTAATPYFFNFHDGDLGNFTVIGPSGSGKTVVLNFLAAQAQKARPRTVVFDKDRGAEIFVRAIGGRYALLRAGVPTGFNPLQLPDTPADRAFLRDWLGRLICKPGQSLDVEDEAVLADAVEANYEQDPEHRRLSVFRELLSGRRRPERGDLASRLAPWCGRGELAWLFDNPVDQLELSSATLGFDMTELLDHPVQRTPTMMYLFHRVEERLDGRPTVILVDEGWKALDDEVFSARLRDWMKTLRKRNGLVGFATQSARDALESRVSSAVIEQAATQIFMPNPRAQAADYCDGFGLTAHELSIVQALPAHARAFLVKQANHSVVVRLDLSSAPELITVLSGREATVRKLDELRRRVGEHPAGWWPELTGTAWPGGAPQPQTLRAVS